GVTGLDLVAPLIADEFKAPEARPWRPARARTDQQLLTQAAWSQLRSPVRWGRFGVSLARNLPLIGPQILPSLAAQWAAPTGDVDVDAGDLSAPRMFFNRAIGSSRKVALTALPTSTIRQIRKQHSARFNDVVLAAIGGGLRRWLMEQGQLPDEQVVALAPILINAEDQPLGTALIGLATDVETAADRLGAIRHQMDDLLPSIEAQPVDTIRRLYQASPAVAAMASRLLARTSATSRFHPPFNLVVVSVPGKEHPSDILGAPVIHRYSLPTLVDGTGLSICVLSQADSVNLCLIADRELINDLDALVEAINSEVEALAESAPAPTG
ncbi:MAG: WS/DGAT domain-containing protein, partial [Acidimicrobiia bacterium]|nr:WS/DGAT domain-containing protein [Acidimicrobiia bacterium]